MVGGGMAGWSTFVFLSTLYYQCSTNFCVGGDTLKTGISLKDSEEVGGRRWNEEAQSLVSANGIFQLGFFTLPNYTTRRYIGIWYRNMKGSVVWVANSERPLLDTNGSLTILANGQLTIEHPTPVQTTAISSSMANMEGKGLVCLRLLNSGNLVLTQGKDVDHCGNRLLWQSFDQPSHTYLPGMRLGLINRVDGGVSMKTRLRSWRAEDDPRPGAFTLDLLTSGGASQLCVSKDDKKHLMSGFWNGQLFSWIPETSDYNFTFTTNQNGESYFNYSLSDASVFSRLVMDVSGELKLFTMSQTHQDWSLLWSYPRKFCDVYARCGSNSICVDDQKSCRCLDGFEPRSPREWASNTWLAGCKRKMQLRCEESTGDDEFKHIKTARLPAPSEGFEESDHRHKDCMTMCWKSCSCKAYASANENGGHQCYRWSGGDPLFGIQQENSSTAQDLYVRISNLKTNRSKRRLWIMAPVMVPSFLVMGVAICYLRRNAFANYRRGPRLKAKRESKEDASFFNLAVTSRAGKNGLDFQVFNFATISAATHNFSLANKLGEGGYGPVYKGRLYHGQQIAVKRLSGRSSQGIDEFRNEILLLAKLQHINLVQILGCCIEGEEKMLVYEYMPNRSLDSILFDGAKQKLLDWRKRMQIINGIIQGLLYLHKFSRLRIIHRDLKASNVLLDSQMNPRISDFGLARIFGQDESEARTDRIVGTLGYMSPEYATGGLFSEKSDVFSFGVLLLEIVSGKKNSSFYHFEESLNLLGYAWELWKTDRSLEMIEPTLLDSSSYAAEREARRCIQVGLLCVQDCGGDRPTMSDVAALLNNENIPLPTPTKPAFISGSGATVTTQPTLSVNLLTVSVMGGR